MNFDLALNYWNALFGELPGPGAPPALTASLVGVVLGAVLLVYGGELLVRGASKIALGLKISALVVGLTIVAVCTSAPEMAVSFSAALRSTGENAGNVADVALGNVVGSNICNILLILGVCAVIRPLAVSQQMVKREYPFLVAVSLLPILVAVVCRDASGAACLPRWFGVVLSAIFVWYTRSTIREARRAENAEHMKNVVATNVPGAKSADVDQTTESADASQTTPSLQTAQPPQSAENAPVVQDADSPQRAQNAQTADSVDAKPPKTPLDWIGAVALVLLGLALLVVGSNWFVDGAVGLARRCGVSELVIGLTLVALGTSLPELTVSVVATVRGQVDVAIGNVLGSNVCNILLILGGTLCLLANGMAIKSQSLFVDLPVMFGAAALSGWFCFTGRKLERWEGAVLVLGQIAYAVYLVKFA